MAVDRRNLAKSVKGLNPRKQWLRRKIRNNNRKSRPPPQRSF